MVARNGTVPEPLAAVGWSGLIPLIARWVGDHDEESVVWGVMCSLAPLSSTQVVGARSRDAGCEMKAEVPKYECVSRTQVGTDSWARTDTDKLERTPAVCER